MKAALITGAGKRIGKAMAEYLAEQGVAVAVHYNSSAQEAENVASAITAKGGKAVAVGADLTKLADIKTLIDSACIALGRPIDCLVNNASIFEQDGIGSLNEKLFDTHYAIHVKAPAFFAEQFVSHRKQHKLEEQDSLIVNIIDQRVWALTPRFLSYTLSKSALWTLTQTLAQSLAPHIRVNAIGPGPTLANERQQDDDFKKQLESIPLQRGAELEEFGQTIMHFWNCKSITGQMIALDGGQHLAWETPDVKDINE
jgi:NAD(P)-dependent dehydrogenase (short-subunit alcohol dehydrogenase family)